MPAWALGWRAFTVSALSSIVLVGCDSSNVTAPSSSLTVTIVPPPGASGAVTVSGPGGYHQTLTETKALTGLAAGSYTVTADPVVLANPIVSTVYDGVVSGGTATVSATAAATASVGYLPRAGSGALWVANLNIWPVVGYTANQLAVGTSAPPVYSESAPGSQCGVAFDRSGNLWIAKVGFNALIAFHPAQIGVPVCIPADTLRQNFGSLAAPAGLAFDARGWLWVTNNGNNTLVAFSPAQLAVTGSPIPAVTVSATGGSLDSPIGLAFDASGNLWVVNSVLNTSIVKFTPDQLSANGAPTPAVTIGGSGGALSSAFGLAFDASGRLWAGNTNTSTVVGFSAAQLAVSGNPTPAVTLSASGASLSGPTGLAFDASGDLWVSNQGSGTIVEFAPDQLAASGAPTPIHTVSGNPQSLPCLLAFDPPVGPLPLAR